MLAEPATQNAKKHRQRRPQQKPVRSSLRTRKGAVKQWRKLLDNSHPTPVKYQTKNCVPFPISFSKDHANYVGSSNDLPFPSQSGWCQKRLPTHLAVRWLPSFLGCQWRQSGEVGLLPHLAVMGWYSSPNSFPHWSSVRRSQLK